LFGFVSWEATGTGAPLGRRVDGPRNGEFAAAASCSRAGARFSAAAGTLAAGFSALRSTGEVSSSRTIALMPIPAAAITAATTAATPAAAPAVEPALAFPGVGTWLQSAPTTAPALVSVSVRIPASSATGIQQRYDVPISRSNRLAVLHESHSSRCSSSQMRSRSSTGSPS